MSERPISADIAHHHRKRAKTVDGVRVLIEVRSGAVTLDGERIGRVSRAMKLHGNPYVWGSQAIGQRVTTVYHRTQADAVRALLNAR